MNKIKQFFNKILCRNFGVTTDETTGEHMIFRCNECNQTFHEALENLKWLNSSKGFNE